MNLGENPVAEDGIWHSCTCDPVPRSERIPRTKIRNEVSESTC